MIIVHSLATVIIHWISDIVTVCVCAIVHMSVRVCVYVCICAAIF